MKRKIHKLSVSPLTNNRSGTADTTIQSIKENVFNAHRTYGRRDDHLLRLALNEAEALAWQTGFPQLVFPVLAAEKAQTAVAWRLRQEVIQQCSAEVVLAA